MNGNSEAGYIGTPGVLHSLAGTTTWSFLSLLRGSGTTKGIWGDDGKDGANWCKAEDENAVSGG